MALVKLKIASFKDPACANPSSLKFNTIELLINPESYTQNYKVDYVNPNVIGDSEQTLYFANMGSDTLSLTKLLVDGTGVIPLAGTVDEYIGKLSKIVYDYNGEIHRPPYIKVTWGNLTFKGVCTAFNVNYTLFKPDGTALRALVDLTFRSSTAPEEKIKKSAKSSPDLTHIRTVKAGDSLPLMTYKIYGDSSFYLEIARINKITNVSAIKPGDQLYFPPLKKQ